MRRRRKVCLAAATLTLLTTGGAQAASPQEARPGQAAGAEASRTKAEGGGLPFSGLDAALLAAGAGPMLALGATLRRRRAKPAVRHAKEETLTLA